MRIAPREVVLYDREKQTMLVVGYAGERGYDDGVVLFSGVKSTQEEGIFEAERIAQRAPAPVEMTARDLYRRDKVVLGKTRTERWVTAATLLGLAVLVGKLLSDVISQ